MDGKNGESPNLKAGMEKQPEKTEDLSKSPKRSVAKSSSSLKEKTGTQSETTPGWSYFHADDPHDEWDKDVFEKTLEREEETKQAIPAVGSDTDSTLNKPVRDVEEGDVSSIASRKVVYGAARNAMVKKQERDMKDEAKDTAEVHSTDKKSASASEIGGDADKNSPTKSIEDLDSVFKEEFDRELASKAEEGGEKDLNTLKSEWRAMRELANNSEEEYKQKYKEYMEGESQNRLSRLTRLPRRMFGLKPKLSPEIENLKNKADADRVSFNAAAVSLLTLKDSAVAERYKSRLSPKVAATLPLVHKERIEAQKQAFNESWGQSKYLRPTLETIAKHRYTLTGVSLGVAAMTPVGIIPVLAAIGAGQVARKGTLEGGNKLFVMPSRRDLEKARESVGDNYFNKSYAELNEEMESLTFKADAREARVKTTSAAAGLAAGLAAGSYAYSLTADSGVSLDGVPATTETTPPPPSVETTPSPEVNDGTVSDEVPPTEPEAEEVVPHTSESPTTPGMENNDSAEAPVQNEEAPLPQDVPPTTQPDMSFEATDIKHTVVKGENLWNIMEGKGPDNNPIGGKSEFLEGMSLADRQDALNQLVEYYENHPEEAIEIGVVKSGGDIHKIYPGEELNISALDNKLHELLEVEGESVDYEALHEPSESEIEASTVDEPTAETESAPSDITDMKLQDLLDLRQAVIAGDQTALDRLSALDLDPESLQQMTNTIFDRAQGSIDTNMTVGQVLNSGREVSGAAVESIPAPNPNVVPDVTSPREYDPFEDNSTRVSEASLPTSSQTPSVEAVATPALSAQATIDYVKSIESSNAGFFDTIFFNTPKDISGTFDLLKDYTFDQLREMSISSNWPQGIESEAAERWIDELNKNVAVLPVNGNNETLGQYVTRFASSRIA